MRRQSNIDSKCYIFFEKCYGCKSCMERERWGWGSEKNESRQVRAPITYVLGRHMRRSELYRAYRGRWTGVVNGDSPRLRPLAAIPGAQIAAERSGRICARDRLFRRPGSRPGGQNRDPDHCRSAIRPSLPHVIARNLRSPRYPPNPPRTSCPYRRLIPLTCAETLHQLGEQCRDTRLTCANHGTRYACSEATFYTAR